MMSCTADVRVIWINSFVLTHIALAEWHSGSAAFLWRSSWRCLPAATGTAGTGLAGTVPPTSYSLSWQSSPHQATAVSHGNYVQIAQPSYYMVTGIQNSATKPRSKSQNFKPTNEKKAICIITVKMVHPACCDGATGPAKSLWLCEASIFLFESWHTS